MISTCIDNNEKITNYEYDELARLKNVVLDNGKVESIEYDSLNRVSRIYLENSYGKESFIKKIELRCSIFHNI